MFAVFLFLAVFSFYCCLAYEIQQTISQQQRSELATTKIVPLLEPASALRVLLESKIQAEERISVAAPMPHITSEPKTQIDVPVTFSSAHAVPIRRENETDLALEIIDTSPITEPATIVDSLQKLALDDIAALKIRPARIVASALNIKQKANGTDKSLRQLQQDIKVCLQHKPELVVQALQLVKVR